MWRYRSELAPVAVAVLLMGTGWWLHARYPHDWRYVLTGTSLTAWLIIPFGEALRLAPIVERVYAAAVIFAAGVWVAAAAVLGPFTRPLSLTLAIGTVILAVPWWSHRRRRAKVRVERKLAAWPDIARAIGLIGSEVMSATVDVWGWRARFRLARGQTITDVTARIPAIESGLGTFRGAVRIYPTSDDLANRFELRVLDTDPHADAIPWPGPAYPVDHGTYRARAIRGCRPVPSALPAPACAVRRNDRIGQERRPQCAHGEPDRLPRCHHLGYRPEKGNGTRPVAGMPRPARHHPGPGSRIAPRRRCNSPSPRRIPRSGTAGAPGIHPRRCPRSSSSSMNTPSWPSRHPMQWITPTRLHAWGEPWP